MPRMCTWALGREAVRTAHSAASWCSPSLTCEEGENHYRYESGEQAWNLWVNHYGPAKALATNLDDSRREQFKQELIAWHEGFTSPLGYDQPRRYVIARGVRK